MIILISSHVMIVIFLIGCHVVTVTSLIGSHVMTITTPTGTDTVTVTINIGKSPHPRRKLHHIGCHINAYSLVRIFIQME